MSGLTGKINNAVDYLTDSILVKRRSNKEIVAPKRKAIWEQIELSDEQKRDIDAFYMRHYGKRIPYYYHRYYTAYTSNFDVRYIPDDIFLSEIEFLLNAKKYYWQALSDKNLIPFVFGQGSKHYIVPKSYLCRVGGVIAKAQTNLSISIKLLIL